MKLVRVPLAVDAQVRYALGPLQLPVRAIVLLALAFPLALNSMNLGFAHGAARLVAPVLIVSIAIAIAAPMVEGIWIGTYALYRGIAWLLPSAVENGRPLRAHVGLVGEGIHVERRDVPERFGRIAGALPLLPRAVEVHDGVFRLSRGGWRAVVELDAPAVAISTDEYGRWTDAVVSWLTSGGFVSATTDRPAGT